MRVLGISSWLAAALALCPGLSRADTADVLRAALAAIPILPAEGGIGLGPAFADFDAAARQVAVLGTVPRPYDGAAAALYRAQPLNGSLTGTAAADQEWLSRLGFTPADVLWVTDWGQPPEVVVQLQLREGVMAAALPVLSSRGYAPLAGSDPQILARGAQDFAVDFAARDPGDPFGGQIGQSSRLLIEGDLLSRAAGLPPLAAIAEGTGAVWGERADLAASLDALDVLPDGYEVIRAIVLTDPIRMGVAGQPSDPSGTGPAMPPWSLAILVDLARGDEGGAAITMTYATADLAQAAEAALTRRWSVPGWSGQSLAEEIGPLSTSVEGEGPFVLRALIAGPMATGGYPSNPAFDRVWSKFLRDELPIHAAM